MPGFLSTNTPMIICKADSSAFNLDKLRQYAFTPDINADGLRRGWVGLGDMLDNENFFLASAGNYAGFSLRTDSKKPSGAVIKLKLAEAIKAEIAKTGKVSGKRKKELKEAITDSVKAKTDFTATTTDCLWDLDKNLLYIATSSQKALEPILERIHATFGIQPEPVFPETELAPIFANIIKDGSYNVSGYTLTNDGTASLTTTDQAEEKALVSVQNQHDAATTALSNGLAIKKLQLLISPEANRDMELSCCLDNDLIITGLKLPKPEKEADEEATLMINGEICGMMAYIVLELSQN